MADERAANADAELYPIRTVAGLTGVNAVTLRAWERRYGLLSPVRTAGGHRVYTRADIDRIHRIVALRASGLAIGRVREGLAAAAAGRGGRRRAGPWAEYNARMLAAISQFDEGRLEDLYDELLGRFPSERVTREVLLPLLAVLGERWHGPGGIAEEHFFGVYLRNKLGARFHHRSRAADGPGLLAACLPGELHETGLLMFALAAHEDGFRVVLLGADVPLAELAVAARRARAAAIVLSGTVEPQRGLLEDGLPRLVREAGGPVFVGGLASLRQRDAVVAAGAAALGVDIPAALRHLGDALARTAR